MCVEFVPSFCGSVWLDWLSKMVRYDSLQHDANTRNESVMISLEKKLS
jgi:hypothetical protein